MDSSTLKTRLETATMSFQNLELQLADPDVASDPKRLENIARERARLEPLVLDYQALMNLEGIPVTVTIFMIVTVIENSCWFEKCNQQIRLRLMFFPLSSIGLIESMEF